MVTTVVAIRPADMLGQARQERQEDELAAGRAGGQHAHGEAALGHEPAVHDGGPQDHGDDADAQPDADPPEKDHLPRPGHQRRGRDAGREQDQGREDGPPQAPRPASGPRRTGP